MQDKYEILYRYFGYTAFRGGQAELIDAQLSGRDVFGIMPIRNKIEYYLVSMACNLLKLHHKIQTGRFGKHLVVPTVA